MKRKSLQKSLIGIASAAVMGVMSRGATAAEKVTDWHVGQASPPSPAPIFT
jgi:hypothetical protein